MSYACSGTSNQAGQGEVMRRPSRVALLRDIFRATGFLPTDPERREQGGLVVQDGTAPAQKYTLRLRPHSVQRYGDASGMIEPSIAGLHGEAQQLSRALGPLNRRIALGRDFVQDDWACQDLLQLRTDVRCTIARLQIHLSRLIMAVETVLDSVEFVVDCGLDQDRCLAPAWPGGDTVPPMIDITPEVVQGRPGAPAGGNRMPVQAIDLVVQAWPGVVTQLVDLADTVGAAAHDTVSSQEAMFWRAYRSKARTQQQDRRLDQPAFARALGTAASLVQQRTTLAFRDAVGGTFKDPAPVTEKLAAFLQMPFAAAAGSLPAIGPEVLRAVLMSGFDRDRLVALAESVARSAAEGIRNIAEIPGADAGDAAALAAAVELFQDEAMKEAIEDAARSAQEALGGAVLKALMQGADTACRTVAERLSAGRGSGGRAVL